MLAMHKNVMRQGLSVLYVCAFLQITPGRAQAQATPQTPAEMLKWSMTKYTQLETFQAQCEWNASYGGQPSPVGTKRALWYQKPNKFKIVTTHGSSMVQSSVSDGTHLVEFATGINTPAMNYDAPASIAEATSMQMGHPMFCGSLLYQFFGGPGRFASLANVRKMPISFGPMVTLDGQECRIVKFWAQGLYGRTEAAISTTDGLVRRIRYGSEPLMEMMRSPDTQAEIKKAARSLGTKEGVKKAGRNVDATTMNEALKHMPTTSQTTETYTQIVTGQPIEAEVFTAKAPEGQPVQEIGGGSEPKPPVPLGQPAPELSITDKNGVKRKLADFRGKVVLIDFWATWCPPCRKGLPETQKFYTQYGSKGLAVLTISDEDKQTVFSFIKQNKFTFPVYLDAAGVTNRAYKISAIPTVAVIDRQGNLVDYKVGLAPREEILAALKKAGL